MWGAAVDARRGEQGYGLAVYLTHAERDRALRGDELGGEVCEAEAAGGVGPLECGAREDQRASDRVGDVLAVVLAVTDARPGKLSELMGRRRSSAPRR